MTQTLYAHMNIIKKEKKRIRLEIFIWKVSSFSTMKKNQSKSINNKSTKFPFITQELCEDLG
jgi:hypothetical protein